MFIRFQEIVPLNAGNVLVIEDNEPAVKWLGIISQAINKPRDQTSKEDSSNGGSKHSTKDSKSGLLFFQKPSLKVLSKNYRSNGAAVKSCNYSSEASSVRRGRELRDFLRRTDSSSDDDSFPAFCMSESQYQMPYSLISSKQMVGIFLSVWVKTELVPYVSHLRSSTTGRGIMGCLGNKVRTLTLTLIAIKNHTKTLIHLTMVTACRVALP